MQANKNIPKEIDFSLFVWLKKGDYQTIAAETEMSESMVGATVRGETFNPDILESAMNIVVARMKRVLERQSEAKRLIAVYKQCSMRKNC